MKLLLLSAILTGLLFLSSCSQCYECKTSTQTREFCKESAEYELIQDKAKFTDSNGEDYVCELK